VPPRTFELLRDCAPIVSEPRRIRKCEETLTTLERLILLRDFDDRWSTLHHRNFAGRAKVGLARLLGLLTRDATLLTQPTMRKVRFRP
jgi:hypothetical protein